MTEISIDVGQESELWGDLAVFDALAQKAIGMAAGRAGGQNGLGPRNGGLKRVARWYATKENRTGRVVRFPRDE